MPAELDLPNFVWVFLWNSAICSEGSAFPNRSSPDLLLWHASENLLASFFEYVRTACFGLLRNPLWSASRHCSSESVKSRPSKKKLFLRLMMSVILPLMVERERERESENDVAFSLLLPLHSHTQVIILHSPGKRGSFAPAATTRLGRPVERERLAMEEEEEDGRGKLPDYVLQTLLLLSPHLFDLRAAAAAAAAWRLGHV